MSTYLFTGSIIQLRIGSSCAPSGCGSQVSNTCMSLIVYGGDLEAAQRRFEAWVAQFGEANQMTTSINKVVAAPLMEQLFTETGCVPIDWSKITELMQSSLETAAGDDFEQGYWADVNQIVSPKNLSPDMASLQASLDEEIRSGLNWAVEKQFLFLISALSPPPPPPEFSDEEEVDPVNNSETNEDAYEADMENAEQLDASFPELVDKEVAVLIQARNSVVAAWLWRRYAASTRLAGNQIRVDPLCLWCKVQEPEPDGPAGSESQTRAPNDPELKSA